MICPNCKQKLHTVDSRELKNGNVRRRRECENCDQRFTTIEAIILDTKRGQRIDGVYGKAVLNSLVADLEKRAELAKEHQKKYMEKIEVIEKTLIGLTIKRRKQ